MNNILSEIEEGLIIIFLNGDIGMDRETGVAPRADSIDEGIGDAMMIFKHREDFFAEDNKSFKSINMGERMEVAVGIKNAISHAAMDVRIPC